MPCYSPQDCFQLEDGRVVWSVKAGAKVKRSLVLPCGGCIGCRLDKSRIWAIRLMHERQMHDDNCFVTLSYNDASLPHGGSLRYSDFQSFMKRLRKTVGPLRFYMCGEYGDKSKRPHYHAIFFGFRPSDGDCIGRGSCGDMLYRSDLLEKLWPHGFSSFGEVTFESAAYVSRYVLKKRTGIDSEDYYKRVDLETGEVVSVVPEFAKMSLKPGIGYSWFQKFQTDCLPRDYCVVNGIKMKVPRYYEDLLRRSQPFLADEVEFDRLQKVTDEMRADSTPERLAVREQVERARSELKRRVLE